MMTVMMTTGAAMRAPPVLTEHFTNLHFTYLLTGQTLTHRHVPHTDGVQVEQAVLEDHLEVCVVSEWRQEEGPVDERILVVDVEHGLADNARRRRHFLRAQARQQKTARFVVAMGTVVLRLYVIRVLHIRHRGQFHLRFGSLHGFVCLLGV